MTATLSSGFAPRRSASGWLVTGAMRGMVTGVLYPFVVVLGMVVYAAYRWIDPVELPPGTITSTGSSSPTETLLGLVAGAAYVGILAMIAASIGSVVGAAVGSVAGLLCAVVDVKTDRDMAPNVVGLIGAGGYVLVVLVAVADGQSDLLAIVLALGPAVLAAATLKFVPIRFAGMSTSGVPAATPHATVRPARRDDGERLREIERAAGERFREVDLAAIADDEPMSVEDLADYASSGRSWVVEMELDGDEVILGYVLVDVVDGNAHIEQITVDPSAQGRGIGRALIDHVAAFARSSDLAALTLTTFRDVAWNAPLYEHLGFRVLPGAEVGPELAALVELEASHGLDPDQRVCMRRDVLHVAADAP